MPAGKHVAAAWLHDASFARRVATLVAILCSHLTVRASPVQVTADRVNLRACSSDDCEVVAQVSNGDILEARGGRKDDRIEVAAPAGVAVWVHGELVTSNKVTVDRLRIRGGPGINYRPVGDLQMCDTVTAIGRDGEWLRIAAPDVVSLWISALYVRDLAGADPASASETGEAAAPAVDAQPVRTDAAPVKPVAQGDVENPVAVQPGTRRSAPSQTTAEKPGRAVQYTGVVRPAEMAVWRRPSRFRLVCQDEMGRAVTRAYLMWDEQALGRLEGRTVRVRGTEHWVQGVRHPIVMLEEVSTIP